MKIASLLVLATVLAGVIGAELAHEPVAAATVTARSPDPTPVRADTASPASVNHGAAVAGILARPLFRPDRRPVAQHGATQSLPRVTGILIDGTHRIAIFAVAAEGARPLVVGEGGEVNGFRVQSIGVGYVTVLGQDGPRTLRPGFDPRPLPPVDRLSLPSSRPKVGSLVAR